MAERSSFGPTSYACRRYEIVVRDELGPQLEALVEGMAVECRDGLSTICGAVRDQSHLHGIVDTIFVFGLALVSLREMPDP